MSQNYPLIQKLVWTKVLLFLILLLSTNSVLAQNKVSVKSEEYDDQETTCITYSHKDRNNKDCALVIFHNVEPEGYYFDTKGVYAHAVNKISKTDEKIIYLYISDGAKGITIKHRDEGIGSLNYTFENGPLRKLQTYHIYLGEVFLMSEIGTQYLEFTINTTEATLEVEEDAIKYPEVYTPWVIDARGIARKLMKYGQYKYRVTASDYATAYGKITVNDPTKPIREQISLKPKFGYLTIPSSADLSDAIIFIDGRKAAESYLTEHKLSSGMHVIKISKPLFKLYEAEIEIKDGEIHHHKPILESNATAVTINAIDNESKICIRNGDTDMQLDTGSWHGKLEPGNYLIVAKKPGHKDSYKQITITKTQGEIFTIPAPTPVYGSLNITSQPEGAQIFIDGEDFGVTPTVINNLLIGEHSILITKDGYNKKEQTFDITEKDISSLDITLDNYIRYTIESTPKASLYINNNYVGSTPHTYIGPKDIIDLKLTTYNYYDLELQWDVSKSGKHNFILSKKECCYINGDYGGFVKVDGRYVGKVPYLLEGESGKEYNIEVYFNEQHTKTKKKTITLGEDTSFYGKKQYKRNRGRQAANIFWSVLWPGLGWLSWILNPVDQY